MTAIPGVVFSGGLDGHLRAYAAEDGHILWDVDTAKHFNTANGVKALGGALDGPGAVERSRRHVVLDILPTAKAGGFLRQQARTCLLLRRVPASQSGLTAPHLHRLHIGLVHP